MEPQGLLGHSIRGSPSTLRPRISPGLIILEDAPAAPHPRASRGRGFSARRSSCVSLASVGEGAGRGVGGGEGHRVPIGRAWAGRGRRGPAPLPRLASGLSARHAVTRCTEPSRSHAESVPPARGPPPRSPDADAGSSGLHRPGGTRSAEGAGVTARGARLAVQPSARRALSPRLEGRPRSREDCALLFPSFPRANEEVSSAH